MDTDSFVLSVNTKDKIKNLKNREDLFDFTHLSENHEFFKNKNKKIIEKYKIETPENVWKDEFTCLRSKIYVIKCGDAIKNN